MSNPDLQVEKKYTYNPNTGKYIFHSEHKFGKNIILGEKKINTIIELYSNYDKRPYTMGEISLKMGIPKDIVEFILRAMQITHDTLPYSAERIEEADEEELVDEMISNKAFRISQRFEKLDWKKTQDDALKWREFKQSSIEPFNRFLENWTPPKYIPIKTVNNTKRKTTSDKEMIVGCSDWHFGQIADGRYLYNQRDWNINETELTVKQYKNKLQQHIEDNEYSKINLCFLGDLIHTLTGETDKGTEIDASPIGEEQLDRAFNSIVDFVNGILEVHSNIEVFACSGNHSSLGDYIVIKMLSLYFKTDSRISFNITNKRFISFNIYDHMFMMEHGYSAVTRDRLPAAGKAREGYLNNLFLNKPQKLGNIKNMYYLSADQHHSESYEYTNIEGYMFPTLVGGCRYSDNSGYRSRSRQTSLVVTPEGVSDVKYFFFD